MRRGAGGVPVAERVHEQLGACGDLQGLLRQRWVLKMHDGILPAGADVCGVQRDVCELPERGLVPDVCKSLLHDRRGHVPANDGHCRVAVDVDSALGCTSCQEGFFLSDRMRGRCNETDCWLKRATEQSACHASVSVLTDGLSVWCTSVAHCTAAAESVCLACTFWHRPTPSNTAHEAHAV